LSGSPVRSGTLGEPAMTAPEKPTLAAKAPRTERPSLDRIEYLLFRVVYGCFRLLRRSWALALGARLGEIFYLLDRPHRRTALQNLRIAFPGAHESERRSILRRSCRNLGRLLAEVCHLDRLRPELVARYVRIEDREAWERALGQARERGLVILTGHFGNWELLAYSQGLLGHPVTLVHRPLRNPLVDRAITALRGRAGTRSIAKKSAARAALRALHRGALLAIPADQNQTRRDGVFVDFFGMSASTTSGPARLAMLTGAAVIPVFLVREGETDRHRLVVLPEVEMVNTGAPHADALTNTQRCTKVIEEMVRAHPEQWIWFHKRWRTQALGAPKVYPR
jgi:KDO2-lipid IV(A) lauroyltransferase